MGASARCASSTKTSSRAAAVFRPHPHRDMEIVTYILSGALQHKDSVGHGLGDPSRRDPAHERRQRHRAQRIQRQRERDCHLLQIWIMPSKTGIAPVYEQKPVDPEAAKNHFARIAAPDPRDNEVRLVQDAEIWAARIDAGVEVVHPLERGRRAWLQVASGQVELGDQTLNAGDAAAITDDDRILVRASAPSEVLLFDLA